MKFTTLMSGSSGNCLYVEGSDGGILIDAGCSLKYLRTALSQLEIAENSLKALFITHEHSDHIKGAANISRKLSLPIYATPLTWNKMPFQMDFSADEQHIFEYGMQIGGMKIDFLKLYHDAVQPIGFIFSEAGQRVAVITDTGKITPSMLNKIQGVNGLILEANHDRAMLMSGPYPYFLKQRVCGEQGHLSNEQAVCALRELANQEMKAVILAHLSEQNNTPGLALETVCSAMSVLPQAQHIKITVAPRSCPHPMVDLDHC